MAARHVEVMFCDDIRQEVGNKFSLMGVYLNELILPAIPAALPKMCVRVNLVTPASQPFQRAIVRLFFDDEQLFELPDLAQDPTFTNLAEMEQVVDQGSVRYMCLNALMSLSPFQIVKEGLLRVRVDTEDGELQAPALKLRLLAATQGARDKQPT